MLKPFIQVVLISVLWLVSTASQSMPNDIKQFNDPVMEQRYQSLIKELRCPKCQNQNLADSNSQIAVDLRNEVYDMLQQNKADMEIINYMVERYGEFVLYRPRVNQLTYVLWFGPALLLLLGVIVVVMILRRKPQEKIELILSDDEKNNMKSMLKQFDSPAKSAAKKDKE